MLAAITVEVHDVELVRAAGPFEGHSKNFGKRRAFLQYSDDWNCERVTQTSPIQRHPPRQYDTPRNLVGLRDF